jgi:hypothetical protein
MKLDAFYGRNLWPQCGWIVALAALSAAMFLCVGRSPAETGHTPTPASPHQPEVTELGEGRYRIGRIEVDKTGGTFRVPGKVLRDSPPLEFLAVTRNGAKGYEALLELDASAHEFNLACILIGLDPLHSTPSKKHFDPAPALGDPVEIAVAWNDGDKEIAAEKLVRMGDKTLAQGEWVYTASRFTPDGRYLPAIDGTAIGFVHDPASIIEHRSGFLHAFDTVAPNRDLVPPVGTSVSVVVRRARSPEASSGPP